MDHMIFVHADSEDDIECSGAVNAEAIPVSNPSAELENPFPAKLSTGFDLSVMGAKIDHLGAAPKYGDVVCRENEEVKIEIDNEVVGVVAEDLGKKKMEKEKCKSVSAKKPPKPPRPPRGLSLDAADQKLIRELAELAAIKRAKIERVKALKKLKAAKASPSSSSSSGSLFAMLCTVIFCVVIICQGMSSGNYAAAGLHGSVDPAGIRGGRFIAVQDRVNFSAVAKNPVHSERPQLEEQTSGSDTGKRALGEQNLG